MASTALVITLPGGVSPAEFDVLFLLVRAPRLTLDEIAQVLCVSRKAVEKRLERAQSKIGVETRRELLTWVNVGLLPVEETEKFVYG